MYDPDNVFAKMIRGDVPCSKVYEDDQILAFHDISPAAPVHVLVVPKGQYMSFADFVEAAGAAGISKFFVTVGRIAKELGLDDAGYRLITNHGADASQTVPHFHVHVLGGAALGGLLPAAPHSG